MLIRVSSFVQACTKKNLFTICWECIGRLLSGILFACFALSDCSLTPPTAQVKEWVRARTSRACDRDGATVRTSYQRELYSLFSLEFFSLFDCVFSLARQSRLTQERSCITWAPFGYRNDPSTMLNLPAVFRYVFLFLQSHRFKCTWFVSTMSRATVNLDRIVHFLLRRKSKMLYSNWLVAHGVNAATFLVSRSIFSCLTFRNIHSRISIAWFLD